MQGIMKGTLRRSKIRVCAGFLALAVGFPLLGGCAAGVKGKTLAAPEPVVGEAPSRGPSVAKLGDGREGFVITEVSPMDEASREEFDHAVAMLRDERYDDAIVLFEKVIARSPGVTAPYIDVAIAYGYSGETEKAEENLKAALELFPGHPVACNEYGLLYRRTGRFAEARAMYEEAIARFPQYLPVRRNLGILCDLYLGDPACALEQYEVYSEAEPEDEQVKLWVADLRARLGSH